MRKVRVICVLWQLCESRKDEGPVVDEFHIQAELRKAAGGGGVDDPVHILHLDGDRCKEEENALAQPYRAPLEGVVLGGGAIGVDDQLAGLVVEGELAEVLEEENEMRWKTRKESCKALTNTIWSVKKKD